MALENGRNNSSVYKILVLGLQTCIQGACKDCNGCRCLALCIRHICRENVFLENNQLVVQNFKNRSFNRKKKSAGAELQ